MSGKPNKKWLQTQIRKLGSYEAVIAYQRDIGALGGSVRGVRKGFATMPHHRIVEAGSRGGSVSKRGKAVDTSNICDTYDEFFADDHNISSSILRTAMLLGLSRQTVVKYLRLAGRI